MDKKFKILLVGVALTLILAACQAATPTASGGFTGTRRAGGFGGTPNPVRETQFASNPAIQTRVAEGGGSQGGFGGPGGQVAFATTATATGEPTATSTPQPTATATPETDAAVEAAQNYFASLQKGDFAAASQQVSAFSLMANKITVGDVIAALTQQQSSGAAWSGLKILGSQIFNDQTILVDVTYQLASKDAKTGATVQTTVDEQWPFRYELNQWRYNWTNIIDFNTLGTDPKSANGLTLTPVEMIRYPDRIRLVLMAQNNVNETIVIGQTNQILATFHFGNQSVDSVNTRYIFDAHRGYNNVYIDVMGLYSQYPDAVEIIKYKSVSTPAWFTFGLVD